MTTKFLCLNQLPFAVSANEVGQYLNPITGFPQALSPRVQPWAGYTYLAPPSIQASGISCGVRFLSNLRSYPPSLTLLLGLMKIGEGTVRNTSYVFSDVHGYGRAGLPTPGNSHPENQLWSQWEREHLQGNSSPGDCLIELIQELGPVVGEVVVSTPTINRNSSNMIRTAIWTIPATNTQRETFNFNAAIAVINDWREKNGAGNVLELPPATASAPQQASPPASRNRSAWVTLEQSILDSAADGRYLRGA
jgi:hypothetical protein